MRTKPSPSPWAGVSAAVFAAWMVFVPQLSAQQKGFWFTAGLGTGSHQVACEICRGNRNGGWSARLAVARPVKAGLDLGLEVQGWRDHSDDIGYRSLALLPTLYWRPSRLRNYYLLGGLGYNTYRAANDDESISSTGVGIVLGAGLDVPLTGRYRLTPFATYTASFLANLKHDRTDITNAQLTLLQLGFGLTRR